MGSIERPSREDVYKRQKLPGETRIVMEYTGNYWQPIAKVLHDAGIFVSIVNALLIYKYGNNSIRKGKTDKLDAVKIANYCLDRWTVLERYTPVDQIRQALKTCRRQYDQYIRLKVNLKNNLITLLDGTFPGLNILFKSAPRNMDGHEKWVDFAGKFWHRECICGNSEKASKDTVISKDLTFRLHKHLFCPLWILWISV